MKRASDWRAFEDLVGKIQHQMAPKAHVQQNERIKGRSGEVRRLDVTVRQPVGAYEVLIVFDCKRHTRKVSLSYVAAFAQQARDVDAHLGVVISNTGFTKGAKAVAAMSALTLQTLREAKSTDWMQALGENAWSAIIGVRLGGLDAVAVTKDGRRLPTASDTPICDEGGTEFDSFDWQHLMHTERGESLTEEDLRKLLNNQGLTLIFTMRSASFAWYFRRSPKADDHAA